MNETGHVRITGRIKDIINRGGVKLNPSDVEALIDRHEAVAQSAIVPIPDRSAGRARLLLRGAQAGKNTKP